MESELGELLTLWSVRLAVACYVLRLGFDVSGSAAPRAGRAALWFWTVGCLLFTVHVVCAFHFYHGWSHAAAYEHTAQQTAAVVGIDWGGGLYFNYLFAGVWMLDVAAWWRFGDLHLNQRGLFWSVQVLFAFTFINATAIFGPPFWKWVVVVVVVGLTLIRVAGRRRRPDRPSE